MKPLFDHVIFGRLNQSAMRTILLILFLTAVSACSALYSQTNRISVSAKRTTATIRIDGDISDEGWK